MNGIIPFRYLLTHNAALNAVVPASRIVSGVLPERIELPAILLIDIDTLERDTVSMTEPWIFCTSRIQVTVAARTYEESKTVSALVRKAAPTTRGVVNGVRLDSIVPEIVSSDMFDDETGMHLQATDFFVKFLKSRN